MSEAQAAVEVAALRARLGECEAAAAAARQAAEMAATRLRIEPSAANQRVRDETAAAIEIHDLAVERARVAYREAQRVEWQAELERLEGEQGADVAMVIDIHARLLAASEVMEAIANEFPVVRRRAQQRTMAGRELHAQLEGGDDRPSFMIALPPTKVIRDRLERLITTLRKGEMPNWH